MLYIKAIFRFLSFFFLVAAVLVGVLDSVRSVATQRVDMLSAYEGWQSIWPQGLGFVQSIIAHYVHPEAWRSFSSGLNDLPSAVALLVLALLMWMIGYRKSRPRPQVFVPVI